MEVQHSFCYSCRQCSHQMNNSNAWEGKVLRSISHRFTFTKKCREESAIQFEALECEMRISLHHLEIVHKRFVLNRNQVTNLAFCASLMNKYKWNFFIFFMLLIRARDAGEERWVFVLTEARYEKVGNYCVSISWHGNGERWLKAWKCFNEWQVGWNGRRWHYTNSSRNAEISHILGREKCPLRNIVAICLHWGFLQPAERRASVFIAKTIFKLRWSSENSGI